MTGIATSTEHKKTQQELVRELLHQQTKKTQ